MITTDKRENWIGFLTEEVDGDLKVPETCIRCSRDMPSGDFLQMLVWAQLQRDEIPYVLIGPLCWECSISGLRTEMCYRTADTIVASGLIGQNGEWRNLQVDEMSGPVEQAPERDPNLANHVTRKDDTTTQSNE